MYIRYKHIDFNYEDLTFKYKGEVRLSLIPYKEHGDFYKFKWPDGVESDWFYNLSRAIDNGKSWLVDDISTNGTQRAPGCV